MTRSDSQTFRRRISNPTTLRRSKKLPPVKKDNREKLVAPREGLTRKKAKTPLKAQFKMKPKKNLPKTVSNQLLRKLKNSTLKSLSKQLSVVEEVKNLPQAKPLRTKKSLLKLKTRMRSKRLKRSQKVSVDEKRRVQMRALSPNRTFPSSTLLADRSGVENPSFLLRHSPKRAKPQRKNRPAVERKRLIKKKLKRRLKKLR